MWDRVRSSSGSGSATVTTTAAGLLPGTSDSTSIAAAAGSIRIDENNKTKPTPSSSALGETTTTTTTIQHAWPPAALAYKHRLAALAQQLHDPPTATATSNDDVLGDAQKKYWQSSFDSRLGQNALGISAAPYRYEVRKGRTVPTPASASASSSSVVIFPSRLSVAAASTSSPDLPSLVGRDQQVSAPNLAGTRALRPPPRDPRRQQQQYQLRYQNHQFQPPARPASSVYDLDIEGLLPNPTPAKMYARPAHEPISPLSTPSLHEGQDGILIDEVSPIDEGLDLSHMDMVRGPRPAAPVKTQPRPSTSTNVAQQLRSGIPQMRRERRRQEATKGTPKESKTKPAQAQRGAPNSVYRQSDSRGGDEMVWDPSEASMRPPPGPQVSQGRSPTPEFLQPDGSSPYGSTTTISGGPTYTRTGTASPSFGQRVKQMTAKKPEPVDNRPAWNGASGRSTQVKPVRDNMSAAPLKIPQKQSKRPSHSKGIPLTSTLSPVSASGPDAIANTLASVRKLMPSRSNDKQGKSGKVSAPPPEPPMQVDSVPGPYPSPPHDAVALGQPSQYPIPSQVGASLPPAARLTPETAPSSSKAIKRKPPPAVHVDTNAHGPNTSHSSPMKSGYSELSPTPQPVKQNSEPSTAGGDDSWVQPPSRFSMTTFAPSFVDSPRQSLEEGRPPMPDLQQQPASVMDRSRPQRRDDSAANSPSGDPIVISLSSAHARNPGPTRDTREASHVKSMSDVEVIDRRTSVMSTAKALPPLPIELAAADGRVGELSGKLESLAYRRVNILKAIKQMTELMPQDSLMASAEVIRKRELEKEKVEFLKKELADIQQEEYELGLKLHRAYKRQDREADFSDSSPLWIRRVTS